MEINTEECDLCSGEGYVPGQVTVENIGIVEYTYGNMKMKVPGPGEKKVYDNILCPKCNGTGKTDWVRIVTGSRSNDIPELKELTKTVRDLMKKDNIFGTDKITIEDNRRTILKKYGKSKNGN
jgi:RecJ-like exonuclease